MKDYNDIEIRIDLSRKDGYESPYIHALSNKSILVERSPSFEGSINFGPLTREDLQKIFNFFDEMHDYALTNAMLKARLIHQYLHRHASTYAKYRRYLRQNYGTK